MATAADIVGIDENNMDREWLSQPRRVLRAAEQAADRRHALLCAENAVTVVEAELSLRVRAAPKDFGLEKATEESVKAVVRAHPDHRSALEEVAKARYELDIAQGVCNALEHKKRALESLAALLAQAYWAPPKNRTTEPPIERKITKPIERRKT